MIIVSIDAKSFVLVELSKDSGWLVELADVSNLIVLVFHLPCGLSYLRHVEWFELDDEH